LAALAVEAVPWAGTAATAAVARAAVARAPAARAVRAAVEEPWAAQGAAAAAGSNRE